jgi:hypothetical protein
MFSLTLGDPSSVVSGMHLPKTSGENAMARKNRLVRPEVISSTFGARVSNNTPRKSRPSWDRGASNKSWSFIEGIVTDNSTMELRTMASEVRPLYVRHSCFGVETSFVQSVRVLEFAEDRGRTNLHSWHDVPGHRVD